MLAKNIANEYFYVKHLSNILTPYLSIMDILDSSGLDIRFFFDGIYSISGSIFLKGDVISPSLATASILTLNNIDENLQKTIHYSVFSNLSVPYIVRKKFTRQEKAKANRFYKALLKNGEVTMTPKDSLSLNAILGMRDLSDFETAWSCITKKSRHVFIEEFQRGDVFKFFIKNNEILRVYGIVPAFVVGNGITTLSGLVEALKRQRNHNILYRDIPLTNLNKDLDMDSIPRNGEVIKLKDSYQLEYGAVYIDLTKSLKSKYSSLPTLIESSLVNNSYLEVTCFSDDVLSGINHSRFYVHSLRQSDVDLKHIFSCIEEESQVDTLCRKIFGLEQGEGGVASFKFIKPEEYKVGHFKQVLQTYVLIEAAYQLGLEVKRLSRHLVKIKNPNTKKEVLFFRGMSHYTSVVSRKITSDKYQTKKILEKHNINTPKGFKFEINNMIDAWEQVKFLCEREGRLVVKPLDREGGRGVTTDISTLEEFEKAWIACDELGSKKLIVEEQLLGDDYRIVVVQNAVCGVTQRVSAQVIGDGNKTIEVLIADKNKTRESNIFLKGSPIRVTDYMIRFLAKRGLTIKSIPAMNEIIKLSEVANAGMGGDIIDRTDDMHPDWIPVAIQARYVMANAYHVGLDIMMEDISKPPSTQKWAIIEINTNPDFGVQLFPSKGSPRNIGKIFLEKIFGDIEVKKVSYKLSIFGKVQNVGFRSWLKSICDFRSITGYVENMDSADEVQSVITGPQTVLDEIIMLCYTGAEKSEVESIAWELQKDIETHLDKDREFFIY